MKIRENTSTRAGDGLRTVDPVESPHKRYCIPPSTGEEANGVTRFGDTDGSKGEDVFKIVGESEDEL